MNGVYLEDVKHKLSRHLCLSAQPQSVVYSVLSAEVVYFALLDYSQDKNDPKMRFIRRGNNLSPSGAGAHSEEL